MDPKNQPEVPHPEKKEPKQPQNTASETSQKTKALATTNTETQFSDIPDLAKALKQYRLEKFGGASKPSGIRVSELGWPCTRYLVHAVLDWERRAEPSDWAKLRMQEGADRERIIMRDLNAIGASVWGQQDVIEWRELNIVGHPDAKWYYQQTNHVPAKFGPLEIKYTNAHYYGRLNEPADFLDGDIFLRKWYSQLQIYTLLLNCEIGFFLLEECPGGIPKMIKCPLDYDFAEGELRRAEDAQVYIAEANAHPDKPVEYPDKINEPGVCNRCSFAHVCMPDVRADSSISVIEDQMIIELIDRREQLQALAAEHRAVVKQLNAILPVSVGQYMAGDFLIKQTMVDRKGYSVKPTQYIVRKYISLKPQPDVVG